MTHLSDDTFELFLDEMLSGRTIDLRDVSFIDPFGMVGILEAGRFAQSGDMNKNLILPDSEDVLRYLERMDFFKYAGRCFSIEPGKADLPGKFPRSSQSDVLLEITLIERSDDIHYIVGKVKSRAHAILERHLHYSERAVNGFIVALSEVCQNIIEHSGNTGFVAIQKYYFRKITRNVVKIAVMDSGIGFKQSLSKRIEIENDLDAIDKALFHAVSRHADKGRGHGLAAVRRFVREFNGKLSIRSGRARLSIIPQWSWGRRKESALAYLPGAQINIMLPEV